MQDPAIFGPHTPSEAMQNVRQHSSAAMLQLSFDSHDGPALQLPVVLVLVVVVVVVVVVEEVVVVVVVVVEEVVLEVVVEDVVLDVVLEVDEVELELELEPELELEELDELLPPLPVEPPVPFPKPPVSLSLLAQLVNASAKPLATPTARRSALIHPCFGQEYFINDIPTGYVATQGCPRAQLVRTQLRELADSSACGALWEATRS